MDEEAQQQQARAERAAAAAERERCAVFNDATERFRHGNRASEEGNHAGAVVELGAAVAEMEALGDRDATATVLTNLGNEYLACGSLEAARECQQRCVAIARELGNEKIEAIGLANAGDVARERGEPDEARALYFAAEGIAQRLGLKEVLVAIYEERDKLGL